MKTYRVGTVLLIDSHLWKVTELEWCPPHQRLIVRMADGNGGELALTPNELRLNGAV